MLSKQDTQALKALAIIMVMISHFRKLYDLPDGIQNVFNPGGYLGVGLFLMLSGYGCAVSTSKNDLHTFFKRVQRVVVPLTSVTILTIVVMSILKIAPPNLLSVVLQCLGLEHNVCGAAWYVTLQYVCWSSFLLLGRNSSIKTLLVFGGCVSLAILIISITVEMDGLFLDLWGLNAFSFTSGVLMSKINKGWLSKLAVSAVGFIVLFVICYFIMGNPEELIFRNPMKSLVALCFVIMMFSIVVLLRNIEWPSWIVSIGKNAYYIYLSHAFFAFCFGQYVMGVNLITAITSLLLVTFAGSCFLKKIDDGINRLLVKNNIK